MVIAAAKKRATPKKKESAIPTEIKYLEGAYLSADDRPIRDLERSIEAYREDIAAYHRSIEHFQGDIRRCEQYVEEGGRRLEMLKEAKAKQTPNDVAAKIIASINQIKKHTAHKDMSMSRQVLTVETPLLFTPIRTHEGSREKVRRCIGAYRIEIDLKNRRVTIINRLYRRHWSINEGGTPCLGEWEPEVTRLFATCDLYGLFDMFIHYLRSADTDSAAYMTSNYWVETYRRPENAESARLPEGSYVVFTAREYQGLELNGCVGKVLAEGSNSVTVLWRCTQSGMLAYRWNVPKEHVAPITEAQYTANTYYNVSDSRVDRVDALPDGSPLQAALDVYRATMETVALTPRTEPYTAEQLARVAAIDEELLEGDDDEDNVDN